MTVGTTGPGTGLVGTGFNVATTSGGILGSGVLVGTTRPGDGLLGTGLRLGTVSGSGAGAGGGAGGGCGTCGGGAGSGLYLVAGAVTRPDGRTVIGELRLSELAGVIAVAANTSSGQAAPVTPGTDALAVGYAVSAQGVGGTTLGTAATATGGGGVALGFAASATGAGSTATGTNASVGAATASPWAAAPPPTGSMPWPSAPMSAPPGPPGGGRQPRRYLHPDRHRLPGERRGQERADQLRDHRRRREAGGLALRTLGDRRARQPSRRPAEAGKQPRSQDRRRPALRRRDPLGGPPGCRHGHRSNALGAGKTTWATNGAAFRGEWPGGVAVAHRPPTRCVPIAATAGVAYAGNNALGVRAGLAGEF